MTKLERALLRIVADLGDLGARFALVGGLAVSIRAEPRTTRDVDLVIAVDGDSEAEALVRALLSRGYRVAGQLEQARTHRLASMRIAPSGRTPGEVVIDLLFASSGIEREVVAAAEVMEILPGVLMPVASAAHLVALKLLADRLQDRADVHALLDHVDDAGRDVIRFALDLIESRGFGRGKDLRVAYECALRTHRGEDGRR